jgi:hypothetical protein
MAGDQSLAERLGGNARAEVMGRYSHDAYYEMLMAAYADAGVGAVTVEGRTPR